MKNNQLVNNAYKFKGQYVATKSFKDKDVVVYGKDANEVLEEAKQLGYENPVLIFVPPDNYIPSIWRT